ncbi:MAG: DNA polymerase I [Hyphomicrobiales bacterium]|nr:DNA polymerase I [Hyphomicrobiales bacterium]
MNATSRPVGKGDHIFLVDGSSFIFRAYFQSMNQDRKYNYRSDGLPTGAIRLFATKLMQFVKDGADGIVPTHLAIIFDKSENSFRKELYPPYKSNRSDPPPDLIPQFPLMREAVRAFGLFPVEQDRYEADDLIATYARIAVDRGADVTIISADKDLMQLIRPGVSMYDPASGDAKSKTYRPERRIGREEVLAYFGVEPEKVIDVQALAGDSTDNIPGVRGIGVKTAAQLLSEYGDLEGLLARAGEIKQPKRREALIENAELARISKKLVTLIHDVELETPLDGLTLRPPPAVPLLAFLKAMEFTTITRRVSELYGVDANEVEPDARLKIGGSADPRALMPATAGEATGAASPTATASAGATSQGTALAELEPPSAKPALAAPSPSPSSLAAERQAEAARTKLDSGAYEVVSDIDRLDAWVAAAMEAGHLAFHAEASSADAMQAELIGISLAIAPGRAGYIPLAHRAEGAAGGLFDGGRAPGQIEARAALARLKPLLEDASVRKIGHNLKYDWLVLAQHGVELAPCDDTMLMSYVLDAGRGSHDINDLAQRWFGHTRVIPPDVAEQRKRASGIAQVPIDRAARHAAEEADIIFRLARLFRPRLIAQHLSTVYETLERPLVPVLASMERRGISIDSQILSRLSGEFAQGMARLEAQINELAGESFNLGSPKQLGDILFGKMGLPGGTKTRTGAWSTSARALDDLAEQGHELPKRILEWRQLSKLKSTYTDALPGFVNTQTRRVHTSFALASTTTGRLSSSEPNLQNIPIRTEEGRRIRTAFVATKGHKLVSADYSQIELRILAHIADIPQLRKAFADGLDIHAMTASEMFGVPIETMPPEVRRRAKAINFGIIYGISAFGLANQLSIPREEAGLYIRKYFERFPGIRDYMETTKRICRDNGYVTTIFGRKCNYAAIRSSNPSERAFMERAAINAPIQGSAADIIRRAMIRMDEAIEKAGLAARMLLQVHDELVFEVPDAEVEATLPVITKVMEEAPLPAVNLAVPLRVDARAAQNWDEAH